MAKKRTWALILALLMIVSLMSACSNEQPSTTPPSGSGTTASTPAPATAAPATTAPAATDEPRELSLAMSSVRWGWSTDEKHMQEWLAVLEEATNTKIDMLAIPHNDFEQLITVLLASGDLPDMIRPQRAWDNVAQFAARGYLQPLTHYIENDPRFSVLHDLDLSMYKYKDDIYGIPAGWGGGKIFWFRQDAIDTYNLNIKDEMTTAEFVAELQKINRSEAIPFTFPRHIVNFQIFYNPFDAWAGVRQDASGIYFDGFQAPEMREALSFIRDLYEQGLMDSEFITNENSAIREKLSTGAAASNMDYTSRYVFYVQSAEAAGAPTEFIPVYTLIGPTGHKGNLNETGGEALTLSVTCRNVEAAVDVIHWLNFTEDGVKLHNLGVEGVHYNVENGFFAPIEAAVAAGYAPSHAGLATGFVAVPLDSLGFSFQDVSDEVLGNMLTHLRRHLEPGVYGPMYKVPLGISTLYDENVASLTSYTEELVAAIIIGTQTIDSAFADYQRFWNSINGDRMLQELNS